MSRSQSAQIFWPGGKGLLLLGGLSIGAVTCFVKFFCCGIFCWYGDTGNGVNSTMLGCSYFPNGFLEYERKFCVRS